MGTVAAEEEGVTALGIPLFMVMLVRRVAIGGNCKVSWSREVLELLGSSWDTFEGPFASLSDIAHESKQRYYICSAQALTAINKCA